MIPARQSPSPVRLAKMRIGMHKAARRNMERNFREAWDEKNQLIAQLEQELAELEARENSNV